MITKYTYKDSNIIDLILHKNGITDDFSGSIIVGKAEQARTMLRDYEADTLAALIDGSFDILIYGDYDADGICSTAIAKRYIPGSRYIIPERRDGYGITNKAVPLILHDAPDLLLTVDCGINAQDAVEHIKKAGINVIVTDHHIYNKAVAPMDCLIVHPDVNNVGFNGYSGSGVIYKALSQLYGNDNAALQLAAVGTICDVMPMLDENRKIVRDGLELIRYDPLPAIKALLDKARRPHRYVTESDIGFYVGPMINAAGRMGNANLAAQLFASRDQSEINILAGKLADLNDQRKEITTELANQAKQNIVYLNSIVIAKVESMNSGMLGLIAMELAKTYKVPAILINESDGRLSASCRSHGEFNCHAMISACSEYLDAGGGHKGAAGMSIKPEKYGQFIEAAIDFAESTTKYTTQQVMADIGIDIMQIPDVASDVLSLRPYGSKFSQPTFASAFIIDEIGPIGKNNDSHTKISVGESVELLWFNQPFNQVYLASGDFVVCSYEISDAKNRYSGKTSVIIRDLEIQ